VNVAKAIAAAGTRIFFMGVSSERS